jgi:Flp pilus assembly protein TadD
MGRFEYDDAHEVFTQLVRQRPEWLEARVNLAIATLNRQREGDETAALTLLQDVLATDARHLRAHYCSGLLLFHVGRIEGALTHLRFVVEADPTDAYAAYFLAQCLMQQDSIGEALEWYRRAMETDPYLRSAYYGAFQALQRAGQTDKARAMLETFQQLQGNPRAQTAEMKYTRMGPKAAALTVDLPDARRPQAPQGPVFSAPRLLLDPPTTVRWSGNDQPKNITVADINRDGRLDLFITGAFDSSSGVRNAVFLATTRRGEFSFAAEHPLASVAQMNAAAWGDFDNDGFTDAYLCRRGPNQLWRQHEGTWTEVTNATQTAGGSLDTKDCLFVDADHDGDLDIFLVNADGPNELLNNNGNGVFQPLAAERGLSGDGRPSRAVITTDVDGDRDVDLIVIHTEPPHEVYLNDRLWRYHAADGFEGLRAAEILASVAADVDVDGRPEVYTLAPSGALQRWRPDSRGSWLATTLLETTATALLFPAQLAILDVSGDGAPEIVVSTAHGWSVYALAEERATVLFAAMTTGGTPCTSWTPAIFAPAGGPAIVGFCGDAGPVVWDPGAGRHRFMSVTFSGMHDTGQAMRSNASGIGVKAAARIGSHWAAFETFRNSSGPGQSLQPTAIGVGEAEQIDFVSLDWSDGVLQSEIDLVAGVQHHIMETQRLLSSCPLLFAWDGAKFAFISDILGVGGLGYAVGPGLYAPPRPWENFLLPKELPRVKENRYQLKLVQAMEEVCYLDAVRLVAYDLPPGWEMALDERMGLNGPAPSGQPYFFRRETVPAHVSNERSDDITNLVTVADLRAAPPGEFDRRFIGRLQGEHIVTLQFSAPLDAAPGAPLLLADGWIEYPYSQTMFAAWQAEAEYRAPTIEARGADGRWVVVQEQFGYPAGMPRRMALPLTQLPPGVSELRIRTNQEIYWDRLAIAYAEPAPPIKRTVLPLQEATLASIGFPRRTTGAQRAPHYDYAHRRPLWDTRHLAGWYTAFGPVTELVTNSDDALTVFGPGEEVHLEFTRLDDHLPHDWTRRFVLEAAGWVKDMDLYTKDGDTVAPLPATGAAVAPRDRLHAGYNTRYQAGR